ncbi:NCS1 family nucleobase:cation symporter-1 [Bacillus sp. FSL W8-0102]|uniref:NCS1 family nucleobase:cation symporter-1 n=1 Tax=Bacillus sp. FSL W8-0102 TaxID=2978205 RepID=UPI0030F9B4F6
MYHKMDNGQEELFNETIADYSERLHNEDLTPPKERKWGFFSLLSMWMSDVHSIGGYTFAAGLFFLGLSGWQVFIAIILGALLVNYFVNLLSVPGTKMGLPFPVMARISFGVFGANIPALIRGTIAVFWYGIQTYLASNAVVGVMLLLMPSLVTLNDTSFLGLSLLGWIGFLILWVLQLLIAVYGMEKIRKFDNFAGTAVYVMMLFLLIWIVKKANGNINIMDHFVEVSRGKQIHSFFAAIALVVAYFSTLMLNACDFTRFSMSTKVTKRGNFYGIPVNLTAFSLAAVVITAGTITVFGKAIVDPVLIVQKIGNSVVNFIAAIVFIVATLAINIIANLVSPAYDFANVAPKHINFKKGTIMTAILSVLVMPWKVYGSPVAVNYFLGGLGAFLGSIFGVMFMDYYLVKKQKVDVHSLYKEGAASPYWYNNGFNLRALSAFMIGSTFAAIAALVPMLSFFAPFSWFIGAVLSAVAYGVFMQHNQPISENKAQSLS